MPPRLCVVLFHGNGTMIQDLVLSGLVDRLAHNYRVVCFDRPGFGYSDRPRTRIWTPTTQAALFAKALDQLGVRNPVVLGHSWGTLVAIALALQSGYAVSGLVLVSGYYFPTARTDFWLMSAPALPLLGDLMRYTISPIISWAIMPKLMRTLFAPRAIPPEFKNEFPISLALRPKQLRAAAEESAFLIPACSRSCSFNTGASGVRLGSCMERLTGSSRPTSRAASTRCCPAPCFIWSRMPVTWLPMQIRRE